MDSEHCNWAGMVTIIYVIWININCLEHVIDQVQYIELYQFEDTGSSSARGVPPKQIRDNDDI